MIVAHIKQALTMIQSKVNGKNGAAELLGINPSTLKGKMRKYGVVTKKVVG